MKSSLAHKQLVIYGLYENDQTERCRYVGLTTKGARERFRGHEKSARGNRVNLPVYNWWRKHSEDGIEMRILDTADSIDELRELECQWIVLMRGEGMADLNVTDGGEGTFGLRHTDSFRLAQSERMKLRAPTPVTPKTRKRMSESAIDKCDAEGWGEAHGNKVRSFWSVPANKLKMSLSYSDLTAEDVLKIRRLRDVDGLLHDQIVAAMGLAFLNAKMVGMICRRDRWGIIEAEQPRNAEHGNIGRVASEASRTKHSATSRGSGHHLTTLTDADVIEVKRLLWSGETVKSVAASFDKNPILVSHISTGISWTHIAWPIGPRQKMRTREQRSLSSRGESGYAAKLTDDKVREIRRIYAAGELGQTQIAVLYGVTPPCIGHVVRRKTWAHVI